MTRAALEKPTTAPSDAKTKVKFDRQILAISKVHAATTIYTDDARLRKLARTFGVTALGVHDLPRKPDPPQQELPLANKAE